MYKTNPGEACRYRQVAIVEDNGFQLRIFEGNVLLTEPQFQTEMDEAEITFYANVKQAALEAELEVVDSVRAGWLLYSRK